MREFEIPGLVKMDRKALVKTNGGSGRAVGQNTSPGTPRQVGSYSATAHTNALANPGSTHRNAKATGNL